MSSVQNTQTKCGCTCGSNKNGCLNIATQDSTYCSRCQNMRTNNPKYTPTKQCIRCLSNKEHTVACCNISMCRDCSAFIRNPFAVLAEARMKNQYPTIY
jgi:arginyl-tRNA--protein-N-Asp/Glu arginylyltransferase